MDKRKKGKIVALANQKGGVGKTTSAINIGASVAKLGKSVLVIDSDPQGNTSSGLGFPSRKINGHLYNCYTGETGVSDVIRSVEGIKKLDVLPTHMDLIGVEVELVSADKREGVLSNLLSPIKNEYDYIFIDCPPSLGLLTINALTASDSIIIPMQCEYFALEGLSQLVTTVRLVKKSYNKKLNIEGLLLTMFDKRNRLTFQVAKEISQHFGKMVYRTVIPRNVRLSESPSFGKPVLLYDNKSSGAVSYLKLAREFLRKQGRDVKK